MTHSIGTLTMTGTTNNKIPWESLQQSESTHDMLPTFEWEAMGEQQQNFDMTMIVAEDVSYSQCSIMHGQVVCFMCGGLVSVRHKQRHALWHERLSRGMEELLRQATQPQLFSGNPPF